MTVRQLICELTKFDMDAPVYAFNLNTEGAGSIEFVDGAQKKVFVNYNEEDPK